MSLAKILLDIGSELGFDLANEEQKEFAIKLVNDVAKELYEISDLPGSLREITVNVDQANVECSMCSLPGEVDNIRGIRYSQILGGKIPLYDTRPRYFAGTGWGGNFFSLPYRVVRESSPLKRSIENASVITFTLAEEEAEDIVISITGETTNASRSQETVTIPAGTLSVDSVGNYLDIQNIEKTAPNNFNITVTDVSENVLTVIPNNLTKPVYKWIEIQDANASRGQVVNSLYYSAIDILYKPLFTPFVNLYDEFQGGAKYDRAVYYKFCEYYLAGQEGQGERAMYCNGKSKQLINAISEDIDEARDLEIQFGRNGFNDAQNPYLPYKRYPYLTR